MQFPMSRVVQIDPADERWDRYVSAHERARVYHLGAWPRILRSAYGCRSACLALEDGGELRGVLPLMGSSGAVSGRRLRSLPSIPPAGPLADSRDGEAELLSAACRMADARSAKALLCLSRGEGYEELVPNLSASPVNPSWSVPLPADPEALRAIWRKSSKNLHRSLNKAEKSGVTVREGRSVEDLRSFYRLYMGTMKAHHALPRSWRQLSKARELLPGGVFRLFLAEHQGETVAAGVFHAFRDTVDLLYAGSNPLKLDVRPNHALYWHAIRWSIENGIRHFDFGEATPGSELERFKAQWSAEPVADYRYDYSPGGQPAESRADRLRNSHDAFDMPGERSRRDRLIDGVWERTPLTLTRAAGSVVYRLF
jgi:hypothetical protein